MKKFSFKLEVLHKHKKIIEEEERTKFAAIHYQLQVEQQQLRQLRDLQWKTLRELTLKKSGKYDSREIGWFYSYLDHLGKEMDQSGERISNLQGQLEQQRLLLVEATKNKKMLDNLRNRKEKEHYIAQGRFEQKAVDEIVVTQFARKT
jgi:flagellar FliJ protein